MLLEKLINREDKKEMLDNEQLSFLDYKAPTPEQLLKAGRKPTVEPIPFREREPTYYKILNPSGKKLVNLIKEEINNPFNYAAGAGFLSKANKARTVAGIGHNKGPSLLQEDATGSVVKDDVARKIFTVDEEMDTLYDLRQRKKRVDNKYIYDDGASTNKQLELLEKEGEKLSQTIKNLETKTIDKIQKRFETNISSRTIPELDPKIVDRPSKQKISSVAIGEKNRDIIKNVDGFVDSPGFNSVYNSTYGGEKFRSQLHRIFKGSDKDIEDSDYLYNYTEMMAEGPVTKVTKEGTEALNPLEIYERSIAPPVTMQLGVNYGEPITKQTLFFVSPKKLANKLDKSDAGKDFFKLRKNEIDYLDNLEESIMTKGYKPNPIQISIYPSGNATIFEGNHRLYRALIRGDKEVPVTFQYLGGAERLDTPFGINELDTFVATGEKGYKKGKEITKYIKDVEKTYSSKSKLVNRLQFRKGGKAKSTVNKAGNYTKPGLRKRIFQRIKAQASHGTAAGKWSARKAQALAKAYKKAGGGYK